MRFIAVATIIALAAPSALTAQEVPGTEGERTAQGDVSVTIYNDGQALVQDIRQLDIPRGRTRIPFADVSAQIRPETLSFAAPDTAIVEQNFDFDLLTPGKLMEKAIGQTITLIRTNPATGAETRERATVLSTVGGVVVQIGDRIEILRDDGLPVRAVFDRVPPNLRARPTLSVMLESTAAGNRPAAIRYLTAGLGWAADYVALFDETTGAVDMQGWVTLTNNSGTTYNDARTLLVAGSTNGSMRAAPPPPRRGMIDAGTETADRERLGDFYLYPIEARTTIANNQTKQVSFLDVQGVPARRVYSAYVPWLTNDEEFRNVSSEIAFSTARDGGLGDAIPAGTVRFYQRDSSGSPQFVGENSIGHTPMGSRLSLRTGDAFDVMLKTEVESRERIPAAEYEKSYRYRVIVDGETIREVEVDSSIDFYRTTMRYTLTNAQPQPVEVELSQGGLDRGYWARDVRVTSEDVPGEQVNADRRLYKVTVPANGKREVRVTFETRY